MACGIAVNPVKHGKIADIYRAMKSLLIATPTPTTKALDMLPTMNEHHECMQRTLAPHLGREEHAASPIAIARDKTDNAARSAPLV